jgi:hypothetical protein
METKCALIAEQALKIKGLVCSLCLATVPQKTAVCYTCINCVYQLQSYHGYSRPCALSGVNLKAFSVEQ